MKTKQNLMFEFDMRELGLIYQSLMSVHQIASSDDGAPDGMVSALESTLNKMQNIIELRCENYNDFADIFTNSLPELVNIEKQIVKEETENK